MTDARIDFTQNDPFSRGSAIRLVVPQRMDSRSYMRSIRERRVPDDALAVWYLGQNGFLLRAGDGPLIAIDPYLTDSCARIYKDRFEFRLDRQLPVFIEPEDLDVDLFLVTHSHDDHADPETLKRCGSKDTTLFIGPWEAYQKLIDCGVPEAQRRLIHPNQTLTVHGVAVRGTFALPTDDTDLNHLGYLLRFENGITFYNSGDTAYCALFTWINRLQVDVCTICINGGFHNLSHMDAARIVRDIAPRVAIPCHYDMMVNNVGSPEMFRAALGALGCNARFQQMPYYEPWIYAR